jgi:hypothetical protein
MRISQCRCQAGIVLAIGLATWWAARAAAREPLDLVPQDSMLCWAGKPLPDTAAPGDESPSTLQTLLELGQRLTGRQLDGELRLWLRAGEMINLMIRYPHALALLDVRARPIETDPAAKRVDRLRAALIVQNQGQSDPFLRVIQKTVNDLTHAGRATLQQRRYERFSYQQLEDEELPDWATIAWGQLDDCFVLTIGRNVWPEIAATSVQGLPALSSDAWYAVARRARRDETLIEIFANTGLIRRRLDPLVDGRATEFFAAWDAERLEQGHWSLGLVGPALFCRATYRVGETTVTRVYADPDIAPPQFLAVVPDGARYAIYELPFRRFLRRFFAGLVELQAGKTRANIERIWAQIQAERGFDVERGLLANLGQHAVLHNEPPHPLQIPLAVTWLIEIRANPGEVARTIDEILGAYRDALQRAAEEGRGPPPWTLQRDSDGVWYVQFGPVAGPALRVTKRFIVGSWSPNALRTLASSRSTICTRSSCVSLWKTMTSSRRLMNSGRKNRSSSLISMSFIFS